MPTFALNFYSPVVADQLRTGRKTATIRLGDKSPKYKKGMIVTVLVGTRYGAREKIFDAVIDKVEVKPLGDLSPREIEHDNPEIRRADELARWLGQLYNRDVSETDTVTVIRFSQIIGTHVLTGDLEPASAGPLIAERSLKRITVGRAVRARYFPALRIGPPKSWFGRTSAPHSSHSTRNADGNRAPQAGQRWRTSPSQFGHVAGISSSSSTK